jgi:hypothetical protein
LYFTFCKGLKLSKQLNSTERKKIMKTNTQKTSKVGKVDITLVVLFAFAVICVCGLIVTSMAIVACVRQEVTVNSSGYPAGPASLENSANYVVMAIIPRERPAGDTDPNTTVTMLLRKMGDTPRLFTLPVFAIQGNRPVVGIHYIGGGARKESYLFNFDSGWSTNSVN